MDLTPPPATRPAEHVLRAHLAHGLHHELLEEGQPTRLQEAINAVTGAPAEPAAPVKRSRRRRST